MVDQTEVRLFVIWVRVLVGELIQKRLLESLLERTQERSGDHLGLDGLRHSFVPIVPDMRVIAGFRHPDRFDVWIPRRFVCDSVLDV